MLNLEGPKQRWLEAGVTSDRGGLGHLDDKSRISPCLGFCSSLVTSRGGEVDCLGSGFGSLLWGFLLTLLTQTYLHIPISLIVESESCLHVPGDESLISP